MTRRLAELLIDSAGHHPQCLCDACEALADLCDQAETERERQREART